MKLVLTGAAGRLGSYLREPLSHMATELVSTDISDIGNLYDNETFIQADLANFAEMEAIIKGADMVVHFGAIVDEAPFETLLGPNFV
jgi:uronate dehydrogenase